MNQIDRLVFLLLSSLWLINSDSFEYSEKRMRRNFHTRQSATANRSYPNSETVRGDPMVSIIIQTQRRESEKLYDSELLYGFR